MTVPLIVGSIHATHQLGGKALIYAGLIVLWGLVGLIPLLSKEPASREAKTSMPDKAWMIVGPESQQAILERMIADDARTIEGDVKVISEPRRLSVDTGRWGR